MPVAVTPAFETRVWSTMNDEAVDVPPASATAVGQVGGGGGGGVVGRGGADGDGAVRSGRPRRRRRPPALRRRSSRPRRAARRGRRAAPRPTASANVARSARRRFGNGCRLRRPMACVEYSIASGGCSACVAGLAAVDPVRASEGLSPPPPRLSRPLRRPAGLVACGRPQGGRPHARQAPSPRIRARRSRSADCESLDRSHPPRGGAHAQGGRRHRRARLAARRGELPEPLAGRAASRAVRLRGGARGARRRPRHRAARQSGRAPPALHDRPRDRSFRAAPGARHERARRSDQPGRRPASNARPTSSPPNCSCPSSSCARRCSTTAATLRRLADRFDVSDAGHEPAPAPPRPGRAPRRRGAVPRATPDLRRRRPAARAGARRVRTAPEVRGVGRAGIEGCLAGRGAPRCSG